MLGSPCPPLLMEKGAVMLRCWDDERNYLAVQGLLEVNPDDVEWQRVSPEGVQAILYLLSIIAVQTIEGVHQNLREGVIDVELMTMEPACEVVVQTLVNSFPEAFNTLKGE